MSERLPDSDRTGAYQPPDSHALPTPGERFLPGVLLARRYRVVTVLGKGGMGEVYRADDLTLGQPVALKFLPEHLATDSDRLRRFRQEVATARKVSHPNVCRVYDIAEHGGQSFLTMEFVDGEDLSSVLKRLGRVAEEKGVEIARQLCSALAAVHDQGLLHRDLKPANVMLDGRGRARVTDFGLAAAADDLSMSEVRSGTPMYQAPEQLSGKEVTVRSDLYALGLVLYELFTGRRAFPESDRSTPPSLPSSHASGLNPSVEKVILKCLELNPADRPRSAAAVLAALPGGDPLAEAVAAGQTPSPRLIADADAKDGQLQPWAALLLVAAIVAGTLTTGWLGQLISLSSRMPLRDAEPALMRFKAREVLATLGHDEPPGDSALHYLTDKDYIQHVWTRNPFPGKWDGRWDGLGDGRPPAMIVLYRAARGPLAATNHYDTEAAPGRVDPLSPPPIEPGMADVTLDLRGRLLRFHKVVDFVHPNEDMASSLAPDWRSAFTAAGLDYESFSAHPVPSRHRPPLAADARSAWEGPYPSSAVNRVRVEAASLYGKPVYFAVEFPWQAGEKATAYPIYQFSSPIGIGGLFFSFGLPMLAAGLAWWNWRAGRADLGGATKLAGVLFFMWVVRWALAAHHVVDLREHRVLTAGLGIGLYEAAVLAIYYLALEPVIRRRWPWQLVGWNRFLAGRAKDPLVGREVLIGLAAGTGFALTMYHYAAGPAWAPELFTPNQGGDYELSPARCVLHPFTVGIRTGLSMFFLFFLIQWFVQNRWLGMVATACVVVALFVRQDDPKPATAVLTAVVVSIGLALLARRFGLLAFVAAFVAYGWQFIIGWTLDVRAWFATGPTLGIALLLVMTLYAAYTATEGRVFGKRATTED